MTEIPTIGRGPPNLLRFKALMDGDEKAAASNSRAAPIVYYGKLGGDWYVDNLLHSHQPLLFIIFMVS